MWRCGRGESENGWNSKVTCTTFFTGSLTSDLPCSLVRYSDHVDLESPGLLQGSGSSQNPWKTQPEVRTYVRTWRVFTNDATLSCL